MKLKFLLVCAILSMGGCKKEKTNNPYHLNYIPDNAAVIVKINDLSRLNSELRNNAFMNSINATGVYKVISEKISFLNHIHTDSPALLAFVPATNDTVNFLMTFRNKSDLFNPDAILNSHSESIVYQNTEMVENTFNAVTFYSAVSGDHLLIASSMDLLAEAVRTGGGRKTDPIIHALFNTSNNRKSASLFINTRNSKIVETPILKHGSEVSIVNYADWISLDLDSGQDDLNLNGIALASDTGKSLVNLLRNILPSRSATPAIAPSRADAILSFSLRDYHRFALNQKTYLNRSSDIDSTFRAVEEIGTIYLGDKKVMVLHTYVNNDEGMVQFLQTHKKNALDYQGNEIVTLHKTDFLNHFFNPIISDFNANFYTVIENAFVFSTELSSIQMIIGHYNRGDTFSNTYRYKSIQDKLADESNILYIGTSKGIEQKLTTYFTSELQSDFIKSQPSDFAFAAQVVTDDNFFHTNVVIKKIDEETNDKAITQLFSIQLDGAVDSAPQFVTNHRTGKKEIVVQDVNNNLYLISTDGKVLWKKKLDGKIQGRIYQVDLYKNARLQLAFTTSDQFLILDRNGKEVRPFVKRFSGGNLNPLAVYDYEGNRNYRFVVTQGTEIFMYNGKGDIVKGFKYTSANSPVIAAPRHFRIGRKDYLVFKLENGELKILNRQGKPRITVKERIDFSENEIFLYREKFALTDKKGTLFAIDEKGNISRTKLNLSEDHGFDATSKTLVTMNDNSLTVKGTAVSLDLGVYTKPVIFYLYDKIYVSVTDLQSQKSYLFDSNAEPIPDFPLLGMSLADLGDMDNDKTLELVVKEKDSSLVVYKMNGH